MSMSFAQAEMQYRQARLVKQEIQSYRRIRRAQRRTPRGRVLHRVRSVVAPRTA